MTVVLGIDAAWTAAQPSGVALVRDARALAIAPSYASFIAHASGARINWREISGGRADCAALLAAAERIAGERPSVIAIDMPLSQLPITRRRVADDSLSRAYASRGLGCHSPSATRPGPIADAMRTELGKLGYALATAATPAGTPNVMIEVFPHAAALALVGARYRVPYKLARIAQYWPDRSPRERRRRLLAQWTKLRRALPIPIALRVPSTGTLASLKRYEDALDAALCAWTATEYLAGRVRPYGDATAAVWAP